MGKIRGLQQPPLVRRVTKNTLVRRGLKFHGIPHLRSSGTPIIRRIVYHGFDLNHKQNTVYVLCGVKAMIHQAIPSMVSTPKSSQSAQPLQEWGRGI